MLFLMQKIVVPYKDFSVSGKNISSGDLFSQMDMLEKHQLLFQPWKIFKYKPVVYFSIAYTSTCILLKYFVTEKQIRAEIKNINGSVWEDSCVEFFISFNEGSTYYNLEFNCKGVGLIGYGSDRLNRELLSPGLISLVKTTCSLSRVNEESCWKLLLEIPYQVFSYSVVHSVGLRNYSCMANFYKCGDKLEDPHYVAWNNIESVLPDFHLPQYFGCLHFS